MESLRGDSVRVGIEEAHDKPTDYTPALHTYTIGKVCVRANDGLFLFSFVLGVVFCIVLARHGVWVRVRVRGCGW